MTDERKAIVRRAYDRMADRYAAWSRAIDDDVRERMVADFAGRLESGAHVLDLGCGAGLPSTRSLAERFHVVGIDASATQIELARQNVLKGEFHVSDMTDLEIPDATFDGIVALYSISHVPREEHGELFARAYRWLRPGGHLLATLGATDSPDWTGPWLAEEMFFSSHPADVNRALLEAVGFVLEVDEIAVTREPEGDVSFLWVIAKKRHTAS